jgi:hypothetical protein
MFGVLPQSSLVPREMALPTKKGPPNTCVDEHKAWPTSLLQSCKSAERLIVAVRSGLYVLSDEVPLLCHPSLTQPLFPLYFAVRAIRVLNAEVRSSLVTLEMSVNAPSW